MRRGRLVILGLLAAVLVSGGASSVSVPASPLDFDVSPFDASDVDAIVRRVNPSLSPEQRRRIGAAVVRYSEKYGIDPQLVTAVLLVESSARPWARSRKGAIGLMQLMPHVALPLEPAGNLTMIESNVEAGCFILADNIRRLGEDDGISAYFWGSEIRDASYLDRVREARVAVRRLARS